TYANHNHFAGFLEMSLPFAVMFPVALLSRSRARMHLSMRAVLAACGVWTLAAVILTGIVYSFSRMGFIAALSSLFVSGTLAIASRQLNSAVVSRRRIWTSIGAVAMLVLASFALLPPDRLIQRFGHFVSSDGLSDEGRSGLWTETIPLIKAYPIFGCGLGGYVTAFSKFKISGVMVTDDFAHNDYLQLLAELGLTGFLILGALAFSVVRNALRGAVGSSEPEVRYFAVACAGALAAILLHSFVDFNLYIPANAMLLAWIAGTATAVGSCESGLRARDEVRQSSPITEETVEVALH
ncbi:MAG: O-antigen ligase family protein, partial [Candidatus Acidiferrales bacterium]